MTAAPATGKSPGRRLSQLRSIDVGELRGVGEKKRLALYSMGIESVFDLLTHYPRRYADRTRAVEIQGLVAGDQVVVTGEVAAVSTRRPRGRRAIVEVVVADVSGRMRITFFNQPWRARQLVVGQHLVVFGKVDTYKGAHQMVNPIVDPVGDQTGRVVPIYRQSDKAGVSSSEIAVFVKEALDRSGEFADPLGAIERRRLGLMERTAAFWSIHRPEDVAEHEDARRRLAFDELWRLQLSLLRRRRLIERDAKGISHVIVPVSGEPQLVSGFISGLPFLLTNAQRRTIAEVAADLKSPLPMNRLLQGEVGSGKTVVALAVLLYAVQGGYQGAFMAPTEVLAEQHFLGASVLLNDLRVDDPTRLIGTRPIRTALLTARTSATERKRLLGELRRGEVDLLIGTHALLTEDVQFSSLGIVVIDEQHRFGVDQRAALREKTFADADLARDPDLLVMTATPIPRTAAMLVYGDLDQSVLDELPGDRARVATHLVEGDHDLVQVFAKVRAEVALGRQGFVICPLVKDGDATLELDEDALVYEPSDEEEPLFRQEALKDKPPPASVTTQFEHLSNNSLSGIRLGVLHGQLSAKQKSETMAKFNAGTIDVLVATTVVEVGIDVPNASVMVVLDADRFGIAQLHQLRGRVGRGAHESSCYLVAVEPSEEARNRLQALVESNDGFELAERDLELRGEGTLLASRQKGRSDLKLASLREDRDLLELARQVANEMMASDPDLEVHAVVADELEVLAADEARYLQRS